MECSYPMKPTRKSTPAFVCLMFFLLTVPCNADSASGQPVGRLLPTPGFAEGWAIKEKIDTYTEKDLYKYINGEAELYYPYGFKALATTVYVRSDNPEKGIVADIYEMGSPIDAFGIYSRYRDPDEELIPIGTEGFVNESQLLFAKNRYFVRLSPSGTVTMEKSIFLNCAQSIAKGIPNDSSTQKVLDAIRIPEMIPKTEAYIAQGVLGYAFFNKGLTADAQLDGNTIRVIVILEDSPQSSERAFNEYKAYLEKSRAEFSVTIDNNVATILARDPLYKGLLLVRSGKFLLGAAKLANPTNALPVIKKIQSRIPVM
jgi:hypothetical protein